MSSESDSPDEETPVFREKGESGKFRRYDSHFHKKPVVLEVKDACFTVGPKSKPKRILDNINMVAQSGESFALMGPSGAGKTTFLELMTLGLKGGRATGSVTLNNKSLTFESFRQQAVYVEQYDTHWAFLTCRETMEYAAKLYIPNDTFEQQERVEQVMAKLGLNECADAYAGNEFFKGMSGGQKKRLTMGMALLKAPVLMLLDEPTSGLDAASTRSVMSALKDMCKECNLIAIATIHQPATEVFLGFEKVMFMANGRTAYCGPTAEVPSYCSEIGRPLPAQTNPASYFIELINSEFAGRQKVDEIVGRWSNRQATTVRREATQPLEPTTRSTNLDQFSSVFSRQSLLARRDPTLYLGRMGAMIIANTFFAIVYWKARPYEQQYVTAKMFLTGWFIAVPTMLSVIVVFASNEEFHLVKKEIKNGMLKTGAYLVSSTILALPYMFLLSLGCLALPGLIANWHFDRFVESWLSFAVTLWCFESMGQFMGVCFENAMLGMLAMMGLWFTAFLFMGTFLQEEYIMFPLNIFCQIMPLKWTAMALSYNILSDTSWVGATLNATSATGFVCPDLPEYLCYGSTGRQVLTTLSYIFSNVTADDTRINCIMNVFYIGAFFKFFHIVLVLQKSRHVCTIHSEGTGKKLRMDSIDEEDDSSSATSP